MKTIKIARPNGWSIRIAQHSEDCFTVDEADDEGYFDEGPEFATLEAATAAFDARVLELRVIPNWELQARYDEEHGTDNGYDPRFNAEREY